jgi:hypothetical protein
VKKNAEEGEAPTPKRPWIFLLSKTLNEEKSLA